MLDYLVPSAARRRLLAALWVEHAQGTATELARVARLSFATAYRELHAMARHALATVEVVDGVARFGANRAHPWAASLDQLLQPAPLLASSSSDDAVRAALAALGAPLRYEGQSAPAEASLEDLVVRGAELARRDPAVARALPVVLYKVRHQLEEGPLREHGRARGASHALGFLLTLTAKLGRAPELARLARGLRDHRVHDQPFFFTASKRSTPFPLAKRWGFRLGTGEDVFASTFHRFAEVGE